jgi:predicted nicotinamide N-methyase
MTFETAVISPTAEPDRRFDARAFWSELPAEAQCQLGETALLLAMAMRARLEDSRWLHARDEAVMRLGWLVRHVAQYPAGPDLAVLGIRACRECGCTDLSGCRPACCWVAADLCSTCAQPAPAGQR